MDVIELPGIWSLSPLGALLGAVVILYWLLSSGRLIPRSSHERELKVAERSHEAAIAAEKRRGDEWKETTYLERELSRTLRNQLNRSLEANRSLEEFFRIVSPDEESDERAS